MLHVAGGAHQLGGEARQRLCVVWLVDGCELPAMCGCPSRLMHFSIHPSIHPARTLMMMKLMKKAAGLGSVAPIFLSTSMGLSYAALTCLFCFKGGRK